MRATEASRSSSACGTSSRRLTVFVGALGEYAALVEFGVSDAVRAARHDAGVSEGSSRNSQSQLTVEEAAAGRVEMLRAG